MVSEMILSPESFPANITAIWTLIGMRSFVDKEIVGFGELAPTEPAYVLLFGASTSSHPSRFSRRSGNFPHQRSGNRYGVNTQRVPHTTASKTIITRET